LHILEVSNTIIVKALNNLVIIEIIQGLEKMPEMKINNIPANEKVRLES